MNSLVLERECSEWKKDKQEGRGCCGQKKERKPMKKEDELEGIKEQESRNLETREY